jgi:hypothetical protein
MQELSQTLLLPTSYLPPIEYMVCFIQANDIYIELYETYPKQTYRNRCKIYSANGLLSLSIPVTKKNGNHTFTKNILINNVENWQKNHWKAIESAYNASPYFMYYKDELLPFYIETPKSLIEFNIILLYKLLELIGINKKIKFTSEYNKNTSGLRNLRNHFNPKKENKSFITPRYFQVFEEKFGFQSNLSILDLLFNEGPNTLNFLQNI